jgi:hypothetical protein
MGKAKAKKKSSMKPVAKPAKKAPAKRKALAKVKAQPEKKSAPEASGAPPEEPVEQVQEEEQAPQVSATVPCRYCGAPAPRPAPGEVYAPVCGKPECSTGEPVVNEHGALV